MTLPLELDPSLAAKLQPVPQLVHRKRGCRHQRNRRNPLERNAALTTHAHCN
jgi:hypothetical protein